MNSRSLATPVAIALSVLVTAPVLARQARSTTSHECTSVLGARVCTWVVMEGQTAVQLGATIPMAVIEGVPSDAAMVWPPEQLATVALPAEARAALGVDYMGINWEAHGHPPTPFLAPHFDFHFYNVTESAIRSIDCSDATKPARLPTQYALPDIEIPGMGVLVGLCVPTMGMHAMTDELIAGTAPFDASLVVGYYGGDAIFFEPMISRERLLARSDFALTLPPIEDLPTGVRYPRAFRAEYDAVSEQYRMIFTGFDSNDGSASGSREKR